MLNRVMNYFAYHKEALTDVGGMVARAFAVSFAIVFIRTAYHFDWIDWKTEKQLSGACILYMFWLHDDLWRGLMWALAWSDVDKLE